jgi:NAD(P)-dependent dehydrogenase (short-subunit alcohol dehydrogenase family)
MAQLPNKIAVVTGANRGIGLAVARELSALGFEIWAVVRTERAYESVKEALKEGRSRPFYADLSQREATIAVCAELSGAGQVPDVLVNNAGIAVSEPLKRHSLEAFEEELRINTVAPFLLMQALIPGMAKRGSGRIINIASTAGIKGFRYTSGYCASKHALVGLTRSIALECASTGVTVNAVCPGWTDTDMVSKSAQKVSQITGRSEDEARDSIAKLNPMGRFVTPTEVAKLCAFLARPEAAAITGATLSVDGAETA